MFRSLLFAVIASILIATQVQSSVSRMPYDVQTKNLNKLLEGYDKRIRPNGGNETGPLIVVVNTYVRRIEDLDVEKQSFNTQLTFRMQWRDERLTFNNEGQQFLTFTDPEKLWIPDIFFTNDEEGHFHSLLAKNTLLRIYPNGDILYSVRISLRLKCIMDLKKYPLDSHTCGIAIASYAYTEEDIVIMWKKSDPIQNTKFPGLQKFSMNWLTPEYCTASTNTGTYSCLKLNINLSRKVLPYIERSYLPTAAFVIFSWVVFWLNPSHLSARFSIWASILVSMVVVVTYTNYNSPPVASKAIDVWTGACYTFVFCVLIELSWAASSVTHDEAQSEHKSRSSNEDPLLEKNSKNLADYNIKNNQLKTFSSPVLRWLNRCSTKAKRLDLASRIVFPFAFILFNALYWIVYLM